MASFEFRAGNGGFRAAIYKRYIDLTFDQSDFAEVRRLAADETARTRDAPAMNRQLQIRQDRTDENGGQDGDTHLEGIVIWSHT